MATRSFGAARSAAALLGAALVAACGGDAGTGGGGDGGTGHVDGGDACGALADVAPAWLIDDGADAIGRLSGAQPLRDGVTLIDRATPARRGEARDFLAARLAELALPVMLDDYGDGVNVYAELAPTEGGEAGWLVLGAHFDGVATSPAANDNATGVALVLAAARYLAELPCRRRGVIVAFFDQEEIGLVGSAAFAELLLASERSIDSVHTVDQAGWDEDGDRGIELELPGPGLADRYRAAAVTAGLDVPIDVTSTPSSDHQAFRPEFAAVGVTEQFAGGDTTPHYHLPSDTLDTVDLEYYASTASLVLAVVGGFAIAPPPAARR